MRNKLILRINFNLAQYGKLVNPFGVYPHNHKKNTADKQLPPGRTLDITLQINPEKIKKGRFKKFIFIKAENSASPVYSVEVTGNII